MHSHEHIPTGHKHTSMYANNMQTLACPVSELVQNYGIPPRAPLLFCYLGIMSTLIHTQLQLNLFT